MNRGLLLAAGHPIHAILVIPMAGLTALNRVVGGLTQLRAPIDQFLMADAAVAAVSVWSAMVQCRREAMAR